MNLKFLYTLTLPLLLLVLGCNRIPTAIFVASKTSALTGESINFTNTSLNTKKYEWSFGDGTSSNEASPAHTYTVPGNYTVTLIAKSGNEKKASVLNQNIQITTSSVLNPVGANFSYFDITSSGGSVYLNDQVRFNDYSVGNITSWLWNFGDGTFSTEQNPTHSFAAHGSKAIILMVSNATSSDTYRTTLYVN